MLSHTLNLAIVFQDNSVVAAVFVARQDERQLSQLATNPETNALLRDNFRIHRVPTAQLERILIETFRGIEKIYTV